jgi:hypothetical protein
MQMQVSARVWGFAGRLFWRRPPHLPDQPDQLLFHWTISFFGRSRPGRTITAQQIFAWQALASARGGDYVE